MKASQGTDRPTGPLPLVLGVTGHRDVPSDAAALESTVRAMLLDFRSRYSNSQIVILSALAEGADRLVARVALELQMPLVVPLPLEQADYESDFRDEQSIAEFRSLLARAEIAFVVPPPAESLDAFPDRDARSHAYANCGAFLVRRSVEIIALWDGVRAPVRGTTEVVTYKLAGVPVPYGSQRSELDIITLGPVRHILTPRGRTIEASDTAPRTETLYPQLVTGIATPALFERAKSDLDRFNSDCMRAAKGGAKERTLRQDVAAVARTYRTRTAQVLALIWVLVFFSVVGSNAYSEIDGHPAWILATYLACVVAAFATFLVSRNGNWQNRYQNSRAFAEVLRVAHFWKLAGIDDAVAAVFNENHRAEVDWLPFAIQAATEPFAKQVDERTRAEQLRDLRRVHQEWLVEEFAYFTTFAGHRERRRTTIVTRFAAAALVVSVVLTIAGRLLPLTGRTPPFVQTILLVATLSAIAAALVKTYAERRGWEEHARRYELMAVIFGRARDKVGELLRDDDPSDHAIARVRDILRSLGAEAIRESAAWLSLHRSRPVNMPQA